MSKIILFIVEGPSDQDALEMPLGNLYESLGLDYEIRFISYDPKHSLINPKRGDITSDDRVNPSNIVKKIRDDIIAPFLINIAPDNFLSIAEVVQIIDIDGVYVDDSRIVFDEEKDKTFYCEDRILTNKVEEIVKRNSMKRDNIEYLLSIDQLSIYSNRVPYSIYYFSSNLDLFFSDDANLAPTKKRDLPKAFGLHYSDDSNDFIRHFTTHKCCRCGMGYKESWDWLKEGTHSLEKGSNINILIERIVNSAKL